MSWDAFRNVLDKSPRRSSQQTTASDHDLWSRHMGLIVLRLSRKARTAKRSPLKTMTTMSTPTGDLRTILIILFGSLIICETMHSYSHSSFSNHRCLCHLISVPLVHFGLLLLGSLLWTSFSSAFQIVHTSQQNSITSLEQVRMSSSLPGPTASTPLLQAHATNSSYNDGSRAHSPNPPFRPNSLSPFRRRRRSSPPIQLLPTITVVLLFVGVAFIAWDVSSFGNCYFKPLCRALGSGRFRDEEVWWRNAGAYAPWRSRGDGGGKRGLPRGCEIDQVNIVRLLSSQGSS